MSKELNVAWFSRDSARVMSNWRSIVPEPVRPRGSKMRRHLVDLEFVRADLAVAVGVESVEAALDLVPG